MSRLAANGLVSAEPNPDHRRSPLIRLTELGGERYAALDRRQAAWINQVAAGMSAADYEPPPAYSQNSATDSRRPPALTERRRSQMVQLREMDATVSYVHQLQDERDDPIVLINQFNVAPEETESFLDAWTDDAAFMKQQPGFISTQRHRGIAGSSTFMNVAVWESTRALANAFGSPAFQLHE